ncbi:putative transcription regulator Homeodomain-LIKE family [Helianthus annuus]|nr:putative transcription regulator Homeodomain-LIKE family [Helianthus annuus]
MDKDVDKRVEWLHSEQYSAAGNIFGEPQKTTRVGNEYQAQIPPLMTENERVKLINVPVCEFGLSIPVTWVHSQRKKEEETKDIEAKAKGESCETDSDLVPVPCLSSEERWSAIEHDSFILGLYIFGKNLRVVNEFMGDKGMPNVISYYYGKFYRSGEHQKWSMYRKKRIKKSLPGKKIFRGWRLQELLSRLLSDVTDECKASLTQVIKTFEEGKLSFEKYVFTLRDTTGLDHLVEAVAIGKGKQDLTMKTRTRLRSKKVVSTCSSLKTEEIVNILKDRIGLSKARLNEFFWAAVWPLLLARGWHYEQATNYALQNLKNLVFLAPGVTKFSRRNLVKGSQYFDSLTEVLNKVASEPHLLEHEPDKDRLRLVEPHEAHGSDDEQDSMKCTVVDTSLVGLVKVRELTSLTDFKPADMQASANVYEDVNLKKAENTKMDLCTDGQPANKQKLVYKRKTKHQTVVNIKNDNTCGDDEDVEDAACFDKKRTRIVIDLNNPRVGPCSDDDNKSSSAKPSVVSVTTTKSNQTDPLTLANGQRQSRRNRALTTKALEALENGFMNPIMNRREPVDGTRRRVRAKMGHVSSCGQIVLT